ncbi:MAG TPA: metal-dependent hydrolase [Desulfobacteria bacterium]|nr:metal-dependent hydrolase [Desulfobacteria bacterium]
MDPLTHYMAGYILGRRGNAGEAGIRVITLCALLPDIDIIEVIGGLDLFYGLHRTVTHSLLSALVIALIMTAGFASWKGKNKALHILPWCLVGTLSHLFLDMFSYNTSFLSIFGVAAAQSKPAYLEGVQLFWPLSEARFSVVNLGMLSQESTNVMIIAIFCLFVGSMLGGTLKGSRPWSIWTDPIYARMKKNEY